MHPLDGAIQKLARGQDQFDALHEQFAAAFDPDKDPPIKGALNAYPQAKPSGVSDPRPWTAVTYYLTEVPVFDPEISLLLGETIHNFRSALDHVAWALVSPETKRRLKPREKRAIEFPMAPTRESFKNGVDRRLPDVPKCQRALFERYQPYRRSTAGRAMRNLQKLSNTDKHRVIVPTLTVPREVKGKLKYDTSKLQLVHATLDLKPGDEMKVGTKVVTFVLAGIDDKVSMENVEMESVVIFPRDVIRPWLRDGAFIDAEAVLHDISETCAEFIAEVDAHL